MRALPRNIVSLAVSGLYLCLLSFGIPAVLSQKPTSPTEPSRNFQPQSRPECTHQKHPIISIQALKAMSTVPFETAWLGLTLFTLCLFVRLE
ncbi:semaphorin-5B isoform X1 [Tachysurus ichikawai]